MPEIDPDQKSCSRASLDVLCFIVYVCEQPWHSLLILVQPLCPKEMFCDIEASMD